MDTQDIPYWARQILNNLEQFWTGPEAIGDAMDMWQLVAQDSKSNTVVVLGRTFDTIAVLQGGYGPPTVYVWTGDKKHYVDCMYGAYIPINTEREEG